MAAAKLFKTMNHLDLFSGIGGFALAGRWAWGEEHKVVSFCEINDLYYEHLNHYWPGTPIENDIKKTDARKWRGTVDLLTAGVPCQPASIAGKRLGARDDRWLWPEALRVTDECRPRWAVYENPADILTLDNGLAIKGVFSDLENFGYEVWSIVIPACGVGANHTRYRLWIITHTNQDGRESTGKSTRPMSVSDASCNDANADQAGQFRQNVPIRSRQQGQAASESCGNAGAPEHATAISQQWQREKSVSWQQDLSEKFKRATEGWRRGWTIPRRGVARVYDGLSDRIYEVNLTQKKRDPRVAALGDSLTPVISFQIFRYIRMIDHDQLQILQNPNQAHQVQAAIHPHGRRNRDGATGVSLHEPGMPGEAE